MCNVSLIGANWMPNQCSAGKRHNVNSSDFMPYQDECKGLSQIWFSSFKVKHKEMSPRERLPLFCFCWNIKYVDVLALVKLFRFLCTQLRTKLMKTIWQSYTSQVMRQIQWHAMTNLQVCCLLCSLSITDTSTYMHEACGCFVCHNVFISEHGSGDF